jgi:hypothetical protein
MGVLGGLGVTEQHNDQHEPAPAQSSIGSLPQFPGDADDAPPIPLPNRAKTWGKYGAIWGASCGSVIGTFVVLFSLVYGSPTLAEAVGILFGAPLVFGVMGGIMWWIGGAIRDHAMGSRDLEKQREAERREDENRGWHAAKQILKQRKGDSSSRVGEGRAAETQAAPSPDPTKQDEQKLCYLCGKQLQPHELASRVCQSCRA